MRPEIHAFEGEWRLSRVIRDTRTGQRLQFEGLARFSPAPEGLVYDEEGQLLRPGQPALRGTRRYLWHGLGDDIVVLFEDGRPFHRIGLAAQPEDRHACQPDDYQVRYDFRDWPVWQAQWRVAGPRKDYLSLTTYARG